MRNIRKQQVKQRRKARGLVLLTIGVLLFVYISLSLVFGDSGLLRYLELKTTVNSILAENSKIEEQNKEIDSQIESLKKDPDLIEELAREHGLTREGELIYKYEEGQ